MLTETYNAISNNVSSIVIGVGVVLGTATLCFGDLYFSRKYRQPTEPAPDKNDDEAVKKPRFLIPPPSRN